MLFRSVTFRIECRTTVMFEAIQKYSIRKLSVGVGSVAIAALIFGSSLSSSTVAADEVGGGATAHYTYVEEQELTDQEKGLIKKGLPENLQTKENFGRTRQHRNICVHGHELPGNSQTPTHFLNE